MKGLFIGKDCEVKDCKEKLDARAVRVGFEVDGKDYSLRACYYHGQMAQSGLYRLTANREFKAIPATIFIKNTPKKGIIT